MKEYNKIDSRLIIGKRKEKEKKERKKERGERKREREVEKTIIYKK